MKFRRQFQNTVIWIALGCAAFLFGCAASGEIPALQEHAFPDEYLHDGVRFFAGPWYAPGRSFAYQYADGVMTLSDSSDSGFDVRSIRASECPDLSKAYENLITSIAETVDVAAGRQPAPIPEIIVMDGPTYTLQYASVSTSTEVSLTGGGTAEYIVPWISAANRIRDVASACLEKM